MKKVLFVCTGNTCRSPMAEALLKQKAQDRYRVKSAGVFAEDGHPAHPNAVLVLDRRGIVLDHGSQSLTRELVDWADCIFAMTKSHKNALLQNYPDAIEKTATLKEFVHQNPNRLQGNLDVMDPYGAPEEIYEQVCRELEALIEEFVEKDV